MKKNNLGFKELFLGALTLLFIALKLCSVINWSWLWVLAPLWIPFAFTGFLLLVVGIWWCYNEVKNERK